MRTSAAPSVPETIPESSFATRGSFCAAGAAAPMARAKVAARRNCKRMAKLVYMSRSRQREARVGLQVPAGELAAAELHKSSGRDHRGVVCGQAWRGKKHGVGKPAGFHGPAQTGVASHAA